MSQIKFEEFVALRENSLYSTPTEKADLLKDKTRLMDAFYLNFLMFVGLFAIHRTAGIKNYEQSEGKLFIDNIGDSNHDVSLIVKLLYEEKIIQRPIVDRITKLLVKIKGNQLKPSDIDEGIIRSILADMHYAAHRASPIVNQLVSDFASGSLDLKRLAYKMMKASKKKELADVSTEVREIGKFYGQLFKKFGLDQDPVPTNTQVAPAATAPTAPAQVSPAIAAKIADGSIKPRVKKVDAVPAAPPAAPAPVQQTGLCDALVKELVASKTDDEAKAVLKRYKVGILEFANDNTSIDQYTNWLIKDIIDTGRSQEDIPEFIAARLKARSPNSTMRICRVLFSSSAKKIGLLEASKLIKSNVLFSKFDGNKLFQKSSGGMLSNDPDPALRFPDITEANVETLAKEYGEFVDNIRSSLGYINFDRFNPSNATVSTTAPEKMTFADALVLKFVQLHGVYLNSSISSLSAAISRFITGSPYESARGAEISSSKLTRIFADPEVRKIIVELFKLKIVDGVSFDEIYDLYFALSDNDVGFAVFDAGHSLSTKTLSRYFNPKLDIFEKFLKRLGFYLLAKPDELDTNDFINVMIEKLFVPFISSSIENITRPAILKVLCSKEYFSSTKLVDKIISLLPNDVWSSAYNAARPNDTFVENIITGEISKDLIKPIFELFRKVNASWDSIPLRAVSASNRTACLEYIISEYKFMYERAIELYLDQASKYSLREFLVLLYTSAKSSQIVKDYLTSDILRNVRVCKTLIDDRCSPLLELDDYLTTELIACISAPVEFLKNRVVAPIGPNLQKILADRIKKRFDTLFLSDKIILSEILNMSPPQTLELINQVQDFTKVPYEVVTTTNGILETLVTNDFTANPIPFNLLKETINGIYQKFIDGGREIRVGEKNSMRDSIQKLFVNVQDYFSDQQINELYQSFSTPLKKVVLADLIDLGGAHLAAKEVADSLIKPDTKLTDAQLLTIFKINGISLSKTTLPIKASDVKGNDYKTVRENIAKLAANRGNVVEKQHLDPVSQTDKELARLTIDLNKKYNRYRHGGTALKILRVFSVSIPAQQSGYPSFTPAYGSKVIEQLGPQFHGTQPIPAAMISRFGFKVVTQSLARAAGVKYAGRMLGDGIYMSNVIDKCSQYMDPNRSGTNVSRKRGVIGYLFEMDAQGSKWTPNLDYSSGDWATGGGVKPGERYPNLVSPEWAVKNPDTQCRIYKCYEVEIINKEDLRDLLKQFNLRESFDDFLLEKELAKEETMPEYATYTFMDGQIPISATKTIDAEEFEKVASKYNAILDWSSRGPVVMFNIGKVEHTVIPHTNQFISNRSQFAKYLGFITKSKNENF